MLYVRFRLSLRNVEDLLHERGIEVTHETVRFCWLRFGPMFAAEIRKRRLGQMRSFRWRWPLDEVFVKVKDVKRYLWQAVDHKGEVLEAYVSKRWDKKAALKFLRKLLRRHGRPEDVVTDKLRSHDAGLRELGAEDREVTGGKLNNRAENFGTRASAVKRRLPCGVGPNDTCLPGESQQRRYLYLGRREEVGSGAHTLA